MNPSVTRRTFLATSAGAVAACSALQTVSASAATRRDEQLGTVFGVTDRRGLKPGTATNPGGGRVILSDGSALTATHPSCWKVDPGKAVLVSPGADGRWTVVYAER